MKTRLKELRLEKKLTQNALAKYLGTTQTTISKLESGRGIPDATMLVELSHLFHVTTDYILCLSDERFTADFLLDNNLHHFKKYKCYHTLYQKMNPLQRECCYTFLNSMVNNSDKENADNI